VSGFQALLAHDLKYLSEVEGLETDHQSPITDHGLLISSPIRDPFIRLPVGRAFASAPNVDESDVVGGWIKVSVGVFERIYDIGAVIRNFTSLQVHVRNYASNGRIFILDFAG
jgi:hypothetical protein